MRASKKPFPLPKMLNHAEIDALTGLGFTPRWYREIANQGFYPAPKAGQYEMVATIHGLLKFYREKKKELAEVKKAIEEEKLRKIKRENENADGLLVARAEVVSEFRKVAEPVKAILRQKLENEYPLAVAGLDVPQARIYGKRLGDDILIEWQKLFGKFNA